MCAMGTRRKEKHVQSWAGEEKEKDSDRSKTEDRQNATGGHRRGEEDTPREEADQLRQDREVTVGSKDQQ